MPLQFRRSVRIAPGVRLNVGKRGVSVTLGGRHTPHYTVSTTGRRTMSMNLPGPFSYRRTRGGGR